MGREAYNWSETIEAIKHGKNYGVETTETFLESARGELADLYVDPDLIAKANNAGLKVQGPRYFTELFSDNQVDNSSRLTSVFIGSVAYERNELAARAYTCLAAGNVSVAGAVGFATFHPMDSILIRNIDSALRKERRTGSYDRIERLDSAAKALGKPLSRRVLGHFATGLIMHAR